MLDRDVIADQRQIRAQHRTRSRGHVQRAVINQADHGERSEPFRAAGDRKPGSERIGQLMSAVRETKRLSEYPLTAADYRDDTRETLLISDQADRFDAVILATPAQTAAAVLQSANEELARELGGIQYSSSVTVMLGYDEKVRHSLPPGFGFLVPRSEGRRMLAATFVHNKFSHRAPVNRAMIRSFLGGALDEQILQSSDDEILEIVRRELREIIALNAEPLFARVYKWKSAMAQYTVGHFDRLQRIESLRQQLPTFALAGNGYSGIGVPDCVRSGTESAAKVLAAMGLGLAA